MWKHFFLYHCVYQVFVRQKDRTAGLQTNFTMGKMSLIDLAGSERAIVTSNRGERFREGANINKSLLALGNCINALADKEVTQITVLPLMSSQEQAPLCSKFILSQIRLSVTFNCKMFASKKIWSQYEMKFISTKLVQIDPCSF